MVADLRTEKIAELEASCRSLIENVFKHDLAMAGVRVEIETCEREKDAIEGRLLLTIEGKNEAQRKALLAEELGFNPGWKQVDAAQKEREETLAQLRAAYDRDERTFRLDLALLRTYAVDPRYE